MDVLPVYVRLPCNVVVVVPPFFLPFEVTWMNAPLAFPLALALVADNDFVRMCRAGLHHGRNASALRSEKP